MGERGCLTSIYLCSFRSCWTSLLFLLSFLLPTAPVSLSLVLMLALAQTSSSEGLRSPTRGDTLPVWLPPPYDVTTYIADFSLYFDTQRFWMFSQAGSALQFSLEPTVRDTAAGAWCKRWKYYGER